MKMLVRPLLATTALCAFAGTALAQETPATRETIVVTGGRAPGALEADRPVSQITREAIDAAGFSRVGEALVFQTFVTGSEFNEDPGTQNDTSGTSSVNLRGLGLGATLVLVNGQRQTVASVAADDGSSFVDFNALVPSLAVERVEILRDGASPVYGADAVAGVINVITRDRYDGLETFAEWRGPTEFSGSGAGYTLGAIAGHGFGNWHLTGAVEWFDRKGLEGFETPFAPGTGLSSLGQPGSFYILAPGGGFEVTNANGGPAPILDPDCVAAGGRPLATGAQTPFGQIGSCGLDFGQFFSVLTDEERLSGFAALTGDFGDTRLALRFAGTAQDVERGNSPSLANLRFPTISQNHPANPFGRDVVWLGRPLGERAGAARRSFEHRTWRIEAGLEHDFEAGGRGWLFSGDITWSRNTLRATITDTLADNFNAAILGFGGANCPVRAPGQGVAPGDAGQGCSYFNPFGSGGLVTDPSDPRYNDPAVIDYIIGENIRTSHADLVTGEFTFATDALVTLPAGPVSAAFGAHLRRETYAVNHGDDFNADNFLFIVGGPDYSGDRDAAALFADAIVPVTENLRLQLAARHERQGDFSSTDPRIAAAFDVNDAVTLRASWSRSYRAPSLHQEVSATTTLQSLTIGTQALFRPVRTVGNPDLDPERADTVSAGISARFAGLNATMDVWQVRYEDLIVREAANAIIAADLADNGQFDDPRIELSPAGDVVLVRAAFVNAPRVEASGLDLALRSDPLELGAGTVSWGTDISWIGEFSIVDPVLNREIDALGSRNFTNFARSVPDWRASAWLDWTSGGFGARAGVRHIAGYRNDEGAGSNVDSWTVLDLQARYTLAMAGTAVTLTAGALNITDEAPPFVPTPLGYDTKAHDPRGRVAYVRVGARF
ncbi:MAG: TonB-dependent receptor domain-containing protein [Caulobacterales bacterium]|uniref:TonB-dependent receptor domain-containing protein n=1 Tax=Glycocaulis sp. TaxID=1969725 RepID=UPI003FA0A156